MKKLNLKIITLTLLISFSWIILPACEDNKTETLLRFHIRANSTSTADQAVKLKVRDKVLELLDREVESLTSISQAKKEIAKRQDKIKETADKVLAENGFNYRASIRITREYFPSRMYGDTVIESGIYDAVIIELGDGDGQNWWCVIYPPLCYVEAQAGNGFKYKSKLKELIDKYFGSN
jgi:stage II sporulation protein R